MQVTASYPGASPQVIADTVASPLEQAINGVEGMMYMQSQMSTDGKMVLTVSFEQHINADIAQIQVQTGSRGRCRAYRLKFSASVARETSPDVLMVAFAFAWRGRYGSAVRLQLRHTHVKDELARTPGVGDVLVWGAGEYSMRVWLEPAKVAARGLIASDVVARHPRAEHTGCRWSGWSAAGCLGGVPGHGQHSGPTVERGAIRRDRREDGRRRPG